MIYDYDFSLKIIDIPVAIKAVDVLDLIRDIRQAEATETGIRYGQIASASGNEELDAGVAVGITVNLLDDWQIRFAAGAYIAKVSGGNLVGGIEGDPVAYSAEVQVLLIQSAASTTVSVSTGSGLSPEQDATLTDISNNTGNIPADVWGTTDAQKMIEDILGKAVISPDDLHVTIYNRSDNSVSHEFDISADKRIRTPI